MGGDRQTQLNPILGEASELAERFAAGEVRALARTISLVERSDPRASAALREIGRLCRRRAPSVGLTGAPGAGKSTLLDALVASARGSDASVGVLAVDPSSPFSGGALLGDRLRMDAHLMDPGVYVRSMGARGRLGGLSPTAAEVAALLGMFGFDEVLIETVGTGQSEFDIRLLADTTVVVLTPGMGDEVQLEKAGIVEIADVLVINKADRPDAERFVHEVRAMLDIGPAKAWRPPVVATVALRPDGGIEELWQAIRAHREHLRSHPSTLKTPDHPERAEQPMSTTSPNHTTASLSGDYDRWLAEHHEQLEGGWQPEFVTSSGIPVKPLYTPLDLEDADWDYERELGFPGEPPYTRGMHPGGYREKLWKLEMYAGFGSAEDANRRYRYLIEQGSTGGVSMALDLPTQIGLDADDPLAGREVGQMGVALSSLADVERVFDGIPLDRVGHIFTTANCIGPLAAAWFLALARKQGVPTSSFTVQIQNDPIKEYIARGTQFLPIDASVRLGTDMMQFVNQHAPTWLPISISGSHMKQAGANCVQEAAFTVCNGIAYVDACLAKGMKIDDFGASLELHFCTEMDFFEEIAKYRAVRAVWTELVRERFGGTTSEAQQFRLHAATSGRPLTAQQPLNNISRITLQILAQILGGCEQTRTASFDEALGIPTEEAARTSIRANQVIAYETGVPYTVDPLGGSYYIEALTQEFRKRIAEEVAKVDEMGGAIEAARRGYFQQELADGAYREQVAIESGERVIVGVNRFQIEDEREMPVFEIDETSIERQVARLRQTRQQRDEPAVQAALKRLHEVCATEENVMPAVLECVEAYASTGEIAGVWRAVFGEYRSEAVRL